MIKGGVKELKQGTCGKQIKEYHVKQTVAKPNSHFQNKAETLILVIKKKWKRVMLSSREPKKL